MKQLTLYSSNYKLLEQSYGEWLSLMGYAEMTAKTFPVHVRELFHYLEQKQLTHIKEVRSRHISGFVNHIKTRRSQWTGMALSASSINKTIQAVNTFAKYINDTEKHILDITARKIKADIDERDVLTQQEIKTLYEASYESHRENTQAMGQRDRAVIAIFYGCGLRKDEATRLNITDINTITSQVFVRKAKGNKQRYVPIASKHLDDIKNYLEQGRAWFLEDHAECEFYYRNGQQRPQKENTDSEAFFLTQQGTRMRSGFYSILERLRQRAEIEKVTTPHILRHSIATHLLQNKMPIEEIAKFLGHSSLESTQIYTHIVNKLEKKEHGNTELLLLSER